MYKICAAIRKCLALFQTHFDMISDAVGLEFLSRILGYKLTTGDFSESSRNLPMRVAILGEANVDNQLLLDTNGKEITTSQQAGDLYGYGSPIYHMLRILRPNSGTGIGGIPTVVFPQASDVSFTTKKLKITASGVATANGVHTIKLSGRQGIDGVFYNINVVVGDDAASLAIKMQDAINAVLGSPAVATASPYDCELESKWRGATADEMNVEVLTNDFDIGIAYAVNQTQAGSGTPSVQAALDQFGNEWNTIVLNGYGLHGQTMDTLEAFNGRPDPSVPTGRYAGIKFKPFVALSGSTLEDPSSLTDSRKTQLTIAVCPAPKSLGFSFEAAANMCLLFARKEQDTPELDVGGSSYVDMPTPSEIGAMADYITRDSISKKGCSTVDLVSGAYEVQDFITTYHPVGEEPPQFKYCRNLVLDWNVQYGYRLKELIYVIDHVIANDADTVNVPKVIKPKRWKAILTAYANDLTSRGLIADPDFMIKSLKVGIGTTNPDRFETFFRYKRTSVVRIASTTTQAGFNFGQAA